METKPVALVTGAGQGIGLETALQLAHKGFVVWITGRDPDRLERLVKESDPGKGTFYTHALDVTSETSIRDAAAFWTRQGTRFNAIINNAGILSNADNSLLQEQELIVETITTNSLGPLRVTRTLLPLLQRPGRIVMVSSGGGSMTDPVAGWAPAYCVSKSLLNAITRQLAYELGPQGISVNAVCPGWVRTAMGGKHAPRSVTLGADTIAWLASDAPLEYSGSFFRDKREIPW